MWVIPKLMFATNVTCSTFVLVESDYVLDLKINFHTERLIIVLGHLLNIRRIKWMCATSSTLNVILESQFYRQEEIVSEIMIECINISLFFFHLSSISINKFRHLYYWNGYPLLSRIVISSCSFMVESLLSTFTSNSV